MRGNCLSANVPIKLMKNLIHVCGLETALLASNPMFESKMIDCRFMVA